MRHYPISQDYLELRIKIRLFSENTYLAAGIKNVKRGDKIVKVPYLYKRSDCRDYQAKVVESILTNYSEYIKDKSYIITDYDRFYTEFDYSISSSINKKDLTNFKKLLEDALVTSLNKVLGKGSFDDSDIFESSDAKIDGDEEYVMIRIYPIVSSRYTD